SYRSLFYRSLLIDHNNNIGRIVSVVVEQNKFFKEESKKEESAASPVPVPENQEESYPVTDSATGTENSPATGVDKDDIESQKKFSGAGPGPDAGELARLIKSLGEIEVTEKTALNWIEQYSFLKVEAA